MSYEIQDPGFNQAYDGSISVDSSDTSVNLTGLIGLTNYKITVSGVTIKDGPPVEVFLQTHEGGELGRFIWRQGIWLTCFGG